MAAHAHLKNEFTEDEKYHNLMRNTVYNLASSVEKSTYHMAEQRRPRRDCVDARAFAVRTNSIWTATWQNQQNDLCAQRRLWSAWKSAQSDQSLHCPHEGTLSTHWAHSEDSDQTGRMPRLIWVFAGRTCHFVSFVMWRLIWNQGKIQTKSHMSDPFERAMHSRTVRR